MAEAQIRRVLLVRLIHLAFGASLLLAGQVFGDSREAQLEQVRARIERLQRDLNETVGKRDATREELQALETQINRLSASLRSLDARIEQQTSALATLKRRARRERVVQRERIHALEAQIRAGYAIGRQSYLKVLLNQEGPATAARTLAYYRYFGEARVAEIQKAHVLLDRFAELEDRIRDQTYELTTLRETEKRERAQLETSRRRRADLITTLSRQAANQSLEIDRLRADEQRIERLIRELEKVLPEANVPFPGSNIRFAALKGRLPLPLAGRITARYGQPKGVGELTWRGLFLAGKEGQAVRAVSHGRVVFADWLRGVGLLLILDHGDGYMTLYGHNEALHRRVGDWVDAGQAIAAVGNTGDAPSPGVYFEIRHNGVPHDPFQWCAIGRQSPARARR